jgi:hypothetical protein
MKLFSATPDELSKLQQEINEYLQKSEEKLGQHIEQTKQLQSSTINILRGNK